MPNLFAYVLYTFENEFEKFPWYLLTRCSGLNESQTRSLDDAVRCAARESGMKDLHTKCLFETELKVGERLHYDHEYEKLAGDEPSFGLDELNALHRKTVEMAKRLGQMNYEIGGQAEPPRTKSSSTKSNSGLLWDSTDERFLTATEAIKLSDEKLTLSTLSKLCKPSGPIRFMRKPRRLKVSIVDLRAYLKRNYPKDVFDQIDEYSAKISSRIDAADKEKRRSH